MKIVVYIGGFVITHENDQNISTIANYRSLQKRKLSIDCS